MRVPVLSSVARAGVGGRWRSALLAGAAALFLAGCNTGGGPSPMSKAMKTLSPQTQALISEKGMSKESPIVVRIFKEEAELEVWKETTSGEYALLKTYPICRWSGELGPKVKEGDRQAPEGFYTVTPGQMNANSNYYLAFDLGFPNAYDRAWGRTGSNLMVHGDCSSRGCYAMTDEQVQEIFALGRESFLGGQRSFQVQAYPFRMTAENMVRHRKNPHLAFWKMLKEGNDVFELTKAPPKVDYCGKRYVFNASTVDPSQRFQASAACPEYERPSDLERGLASRRQDMDTRLASAGSFSPVAPIKTGKDGGMHKVFLAKLENPKLSAPGSLPAVVKPPGSDYGVATNVPAPEESIALANADSVLEPASVDEPRLAASTPVPLPRPNDAPGGPRTQVASSSSSGGLFDIFSAMVPAKSEPGPQVAALPSASGGGFLDGLKGLFSSEPEPAPVVAETAAEVPAPAPVRPAPPAAQRAPAPARAAVPPAAPAPARPAVERPAAAPVASTVAEPSSVVARPSHPGYSSAPSTATGVAPAPELRPSVAASSTAGAASAGTSAQSLPGASILSPGTFSSTIQ